MKTISPNMISLRKFCISQGIVCICIISDETLKKGNDIHIRCFCPGVGVDEDPVTGSVVSGLIKYIDELGISRKNSLQIEQGWFIGHKVIMSIDVIRNNNKTQVLTQVNAKNITVDEISL